MRGCNHYSDGSHMPWNLSQRYDNDRVKWMTELRNRHREWGFTFLAPSIGGAAIDPATLGDNPSKAQLVVRVPEWTAEERVRADFPFTPFLGVPKEYMAGEGMGDVWSDEFLAAVDARCRELVAPLRDNKQLIGYHFSHNPPWNSRARSFETVDQAMHSAGQPGIEAMGEADATHLRHHRSLARSLRRADQRVERYRKAAESTERLRIRRQATGGHGRLHAADLRAVVSRPSRCDPAVRSSIT